jgi:hypothetical protein
LLCTRFIHTLSTRPKVGCFPQIAATHFCLPTRAVGSVPSRAPPHKSSWMSALVGKVSPAGSGTARRQQQRLETKGGSCSLPRSQQLFGTSYLQRCRRQIGLTTAAAANDEVGGDAQRLIGADAAASTVDAAAVALPSTCGSCMSRQRLSAAALLLPNPRMYTRRIGKPNQPRRHAAARCQTLCPSCRSATAPLSCGRLVRRAAVGRRLVALGARYVYYRSGLL